VGEQHQTHLVWANGEKEASNAFVFYAASGSATRGSVLKMKIRYYI